MSSDSLPVLCMRPHYVEKLWGGTRLASLPAKLRPRHAPPAGRIGEAWEVADLPEGQSAVDGGPFDGKTLREMVARFGHALVGECAPAADGILRFPILVKLIDADDELSVQVHPDAAYCAAHPGTFPKDEAWLVVDAARGARMLHGTKVGVTAAHFRAAIDAGRAHTELREVRAGVGDLLRIPPGTLHAVGRGCLLLEVQEPSDTTFRVFDYNRTDAHGKKRALHVEEAMEVARFGAQPDPLVGATRIDGRGASLPTLEATHFALAVHDIGEQPEGFHSDVPLVVFALEGDAVVVDTQGEHALPRGGSCIVPPDTRVDVWSRGPHPHARIVVMRPR